MLKPIGLLSACLCLLVGCSAVGPDYAGAPDPAPDAGARGAFLRAEATATPRQPQSAWWRAFGDPKLDALAQTAIAANTDAAAAMARLAAARAVLGRAAADRLPSGSLGGGYSRSLPSFAQFGVNLPGVKLKDFNLYQADFDASWELDLFGGQRRAVESALDQAAAAAADLDDVRLSIAADTVEAYLDLRYRQARLAVLERSAKIDGQLVDLTEERQAAGAASRLDLERIRAQREATLADTPSVKADIAAALNRLATLTGREPGALDAELSTPAPLPLPPAEVAVGDPAGMIRRRPDIQAAERRLAADTAAIGVATADLFPKVTLNGSIGLAANDIGQFATPASFIYSAGPSISWAVLDIPRTHARIDEAEARRDESAARYRGIVLAALRDAESGLARYARQIETLAARRRALASAELAAELAEQRYAEGAASSLETLDADRQRLSAEEQSRAAEADLSRDYVALQKSLGLAWNGADGARPVPD